MAGRAIAVRAGTVFLLAITALLCHISVAEETTASVKVEAGGPGSPILHKHARVLLAQARAENQKTISVVIATTSDGNPRIAESLIHLGGRIRFQDDEVGYLRAMVPTDAVETIAAIDGVLRLDVDVSTGLYQSQVGSARSTSKPLVSPPSVSTPAVNSYLPIHVMGVPQFISRNPTFDGRGVTIGVIEPGIDLLAPELQNATTLEGRTVRKIAGFVTTSDPESGDPMWVSLEPVRAHRDGVITWHGNAYKTREQGVFRIGELDERNTAKFGMDDLNHDGNPPAASRVFAVLADPVRRTVWVDIDQDRSFDDEKPLKTSGDGIEGGLFNPTARMKRERAAFTVELDKSTQYVHFNLDSSHGTMVASTVAGRGFLGSEMNGVAPGAQVVLLQFGHLNYMGALIEALIYAYRDPNIDLVTCSCGAYTSLNDGQSLVLDVVIDRLSTRYRKPLTGSGGNGPWLNLVHPPGASNGAFAIGGYVDRGTFSSNIGIDVPRNDYLAAYARGPREDGGLQPFVVAPTFALAGASIWRSKQIKPYTLPPGYAIGGGTSQAAPMAAGVLTLLISAAKQRGISHDIDRLRLAVATGARFLTEYGAYEQGNGLIQVGPAWDALQRMIDEPIHIDTRAPVRTELSSLLATPGDGQGLFEREGWQVGMRATREIILTRTSGPHSNIKYGLRWVGNDGTFKSSPTVSLPLNHPTAISVLVSANESGVHSAILNLVDPSSQTVAHQILHTIVVAEPLNTSNRYALKRVLPLSIGDVKSVFVQVPVGTRVLHTTVSAEQGRVKLEGMFAPSGDSSKRYPVLYRRPSSVALPGHDAWLTVEDPAPGVWQIQVSNVRESASDAESPAVPANARISIAAYRARLNIDGQGRMAMVNELAPIDGEITSLGVGRIVKSELVLSRASPQIIRDIDIPAGTEQLLVRVQSNSIAGADLDLYALLCQAEDSCVPMFVRDGLGGVEEILVPQPMPGRWVVVIDPAHVPVKPLRVRYTELMTAEKFGRINLLSTTRTKTNWSMVKSVSTQSHEEGDHLATIATVTSKYISAHRPKNGGRQVAAVPPGGFSLTETPAILGKEIVLVSPGSSATEGPAL